MNATAIAETLAHAVPDALVLTGGGLDGYDIRGLTPSVAVRPRTAEGVATVLQLAHEHGWAVAPRGGGTLHDLGNQPERLDIVLDMTALDAVVDYQPDDMTIAVQAGITLAALERVLAERGQMLPLDAPLPARATIGGTLAANVSGPRRLRFGTARDLTIGMQVALPEEGLARSGGRVVKNVAGYDLAKLHIGSLGTAGVITEATFKVQPLPTGRGALAAAFDDRDAALSVALQLVRGQLFPAAVELLDFGAARRLLAGTRAEPASDQWFLAVLLLGIPAAVSRATREVMTLCTLSGAPVVTALEMEERERLFAGIRDYGRTDENKAELIARAAVLPAQTGAAINALTELGSQLGHAPEIVVRPGAGLVFGYWRSAPAEALPGAVAAARERLAQLGGWLVIERAPLPALAGLDVWGLTGNDLALMRRLKATYDPRRILNPGRYVDYL
jgi:glycolate oxidase FAD binding subunit